MDLERKFKNIPSKIIQLLRYLFHTKTNAKIHAVYNTAVVNFSNGILNKDKGRYSFILCQLLKFSGFKVILRVNREYFSKGAPYKMMLLNQRFRLIRNAGQEKNSVVLYEKNKKRKTIVFAYGKALINKKIDAYYMPYTLHPRFYQEYLKTPDFELYRKLERRTRIIFAGNFNRELYSKSILKELFPGTISRVEVLDHIKDKFSDNPVVLHSSTKEHLYGLLSGTTARHKFIISEARTPDEDWLSILSKTDFYLCLPGVKMPWSHNAFEAMAVGTIPILQYNNLFYPSLKHLENCITYNDYTSLGQVILEVLDMSPEQVAAMKQAVIDYYDAYLATERTVEKIESFFKSEEESLCIALPFLDS